MQKKGLTVRLNKILFTETLEFKVELNKQNFLETN